MPVLGWWERPLKPPECLMTSLYAVFLLGSSIVSRLDVENEPFMDGFGPGSFFVVVHSLHLIINNVR